MANRDDPCPLCGHSQNSRTGPASVAPVSRLGVRPPTRPVRPPSVPADKIPISALTLSTRARNALVVARIKTVGTLITKRRADLLCIKSNQGGLMIGPKSIKEICAQLAELGLALAVE